MSAEELDVHVMLTQRVVAAEIIVRHLAGLKPEELVARDSFDFNQRAAVRAVSELIKSAQRVDEQAQRAIAEHVKKHP